MNEKAFKNTLYKQLSKLSETSSELKYDDQFQEFLSIFPMVKLSLNKTNKFSGNFRCQYSTELNLKVPFEKQELFNIYFDYIYDCANNLYGIQDDHCITSVIISPIIEENEVIDMSNRTRTNTQKKAIDDANLFMSEGKYDSAYDRIHTFFMGYIRSILDEKDISYNEKDTCNKLYNLLYSSINDGNSEVEQKKKTIFKSMTGTINSINDFRNKNSLAHDNGNILSKADAKLTINLIDIITDYIEQQL